MHENLSLFTSLFALGYNPIPVIWDLPSKTVTKYPEHNDDATNGKPQISDVERWLNNGFKNFNGIALKLFPPFGMLDFDTKNTTKKDIYKDWFKIVANTNPDILSKICIETTRSGGYHVYLKYDKLSHKIPIARNPEGAETISLYTGGLLSFCYPSPNYELIHNEFQDVDYLTDDEYHLLISTAAIFNECQEFVSGESKITLIDYPVEYENICLQFDDKIDDDSYETLLNSISLYRLPDDKQRQFDRKKYLAYLRRGSNASYSAKVYFKSRRLLIFSASMLDFPTWHDSAKSQDNSWVLTPSKIIYYKNKKNWINAIEEIKLICESAAIDLIEYKPITEQPLLKNEERLRFPYDIFPDEILNYISYHKIQHEYIAGALLSSIATSIGNTVQLNVMDGYKVKPILYIVVVSPAGGGKTPAMNIAFAPLEEYNMRLYDAYRESAKQYKQDLAAYKRDKNIKEEPTEPPLPQVLIKDSTIEMVLKILSANPVGCCLQADELIGFINRMNQYKNGDDVQKWLELWNGSPILMQRITREENYVKEPFCNIFGGIQVGVLDTLSKDEKEHNGFFHRFLFVYPKPEDKPDFGKVNIPDHVSMNFNNYFAEILYLRNQPKSYYRLSQNAEDLYKQWFDYKNIQYNKAHSDQVKGIISKYQNYCLRLALVIQVMNERTNRSGIVSHTAMEQGIRLTEYFLGNMYKAIKILTPETPVDKLSSPYDELYRMLPDTFTTKTAIQIGSNININEGGVKMLLSRNCNGAKKIFNQIERGKWEKLY